MQKHRKPEDFLKVPQYPGGKQAMIKFLDESLVYPKEALEAKIEGTIEVEFFVDGLGKIKKVKILKGIGHGCDQEVIRLIKLLVFEKAINRGYKTLTRKSLKINFKLPKPKSSKIQYNIVSKPTTPKPSPTTNYSYTININSKK